MAVFFCHAFQLTVNVNHDLKESLAMKGFLNALLDRRVIKESTYRRVSWSLAFENLLQVSLTKSVGLDCAL